MPFYIHAPQGRTARLTKESGLREIEGIFVNHFSTCHMVVIIGEAGISVTHADYKTLTADIEKEIAWAGENCEKIILYREEHQKQLMSEVSPSLLNAKSHYFIFKVWAPAELKQKNKWVRLPVSDEIDPMVIGFRENVSTKSHKNITNLKVGEKPDYLLRHPNEKEFSTAHQIEQVLCFNDLQPARKSNLIFDGLAWEPIPGNEGNVLHTDKTHVKKYLKFILEDGRLFMKIAGRLAGARDAILNESGGKCLMLDNSPALSMKAAKYFQDYRSNDTPDTIFIRDLQEILADQRMPHHLMSRPIATPTDKTFVAAITQLFKKNSFELLEKIITEYENKASNTSFKKYFIDNYKAAKDNYLERVEHINIAKLYKETKEKVSFLMKDSMKFWQEKDYAKAYEFFVKMYSYSWCYEKSDPDFINLVGNLGTCLVYLQRYDEARKYFEQAIQLRKLYKVSLDTLEKFQLKLKDCFEKMTSTEAKVAKDETQVSSASQVASAAATSLSLDNTSPKKPMGFSQQEKVSGKDQAEREHQKKYQDMCNFLRKFSETKSQEEIDIYLEQLPKMIAEGMDFSIKSANGQSALEIIEPYGSDLKQQILAVLKNEEGVLPAAKRRRLQHGS